MIAGGNWWRANEIVIRHLTRPTATRYRCRDRALKWLDEINVISNKPFVAARPAAVAPIDPAAAALLDEDLDYRIAKRIGSLDGWRSFLIAHGSGVHAQSAREDVEKLLLAEKAPTPPGAEVSNRASTDAKAVSEVMGSAPPSPGVEVAALTPDEICKGDGDRLERLRSSPTSDEAARFANELGCEKLRPQLLGLMGSLGYAAPTPPAAEVSNGAPPPAKAGTEVVGTEHYRATKETDPEVARKNSMVRHALAYSCVTTDAAGHRWVHIRPIHYSQQE
jgi:hypothetical protein